MRSLISSALFILKPAFTIASLQPSPAEKRIALFNPKTEEHLETIFWANGDYLEDSLSDIDYMMRDLRNDEIKPIKIELIELLFDIQDNLKLCEPFHVISGFRSLETNNRLRKQGWAAAKNSYHIQGKAVDIRLSNVSTASLRRAAYKLKGGGVGYYPRLNFVHIDTGPSRYWTK